MSRNSKNNKYRHAKATGANKPSASTKTANTSYSSAKTNTDTIKTTSETTSKTQPISNLAERNKTPQENKNSHQKQEQREAKPTSSKSKKGLWALIIIGTTLLVGIVGTLIGGKMRDGYEKPPAYPPEILFPIVWIILYIAIGIAAFFAFISVRDKKKQMHDLIWYGVHLFLNLLWPLFFFRLDMLIFASIWLVAMVVTSIVLTYRYYRANMTSGIIFTIYTIWLLYALYLSLGITMLNIM